MFIFKVAVRCISLLCIPLFSGCAGIQPWLDNYGLKQTARTILGEPLSGNPENLRAFLDSAVLEVVTRPPADVGFFERPLDQWRLGRSKKGAVIATEHLFASGFSEKNKTDTARYYLYRTASLQNGKVILWVPGMGVSDFAFGFIRKFFLTALDNGYAVAVYIPPFHMERRLSGKENGYGFFGADPLSNIQVVLGMVRELRMITAHLSSQGVAAIGGWGGSMGATALLLMATFQPLDHIAIMIPVVDWVTLVCNNPHFVLGNTKLETYGYDAALLRRAYGFISPMQYSVLIDPRRLKILYARQDQLTPEAVTVAYAKKKGISLISGYDRSHSTILLTSEMYREYDRFLKSMQE